MAKTFFYLLIIIAISLCLLLSSCCSPLNLILGNVSRGSDSDFKSELIVTYDADISANIDVSNPRSFRMGFTPFPYDYTNDAVAFT